MKWCVCISIRRFIYELRIFGKNFLYCGQVSARRGQAENFFIACQMIQFLLGLASVLHGLNLNSGGPWLFFCSSRIRWLRLSSALFRSCRGRTRFLCSFCIRLFCGQFHWADPLNPVISRWKGEVCTRSVARGYALTVLKTRKMRGPQKESSSRLKQMAKFLRAVELW